VTARIVRVKRVERWNRFIDAPPSSPSRTLRSPVPWHKSRDHFAAVVGDDVDASVGAIGFGPTSAVLDVVFNHVAHFPVERSGR
jgi:hypothetical protein